MFSTSDTIVAIATPPGRGGIGVVRISGPDALTIAGRLIARAKPLEPRRATLTGIRPSGAAATARLKPDATSAPASPAPAVQVKPDTAWTLAAPAPAASAGTIDQVVATFFPAPHSYTGEDVVELSAHGSPVVLRAIVTAAIDAGARLAEPGEFTLRAFVSGRIDLMQAEAVADLIDSVTPLQARAAFDQLQGTLTRTVGEIDAALFDLIARLEASVDFSGEGYHFVEPGALAGAIQALLARTSALLQTARRGRLVREGFQLAIVGKPNVGKSSLFNALAGAARAIVTDVPGTTRDLVTDVVDLDGLRVTLVDTAGLHETQDRVEAEGVNRSRQAHRVADLVLVVLDRSQPLDADDWKVLEATAGRPRLIAANKSDMPPAWNIRDLEPAAAAMSAATGDGLDRLRRGIASALDIDLQQERPAITNVRHIALVQRADDALARARAAVLESGGALPEEFVLADLQDARAALEEIAGRRVTDDLLAHIFSRFCIGK